MLNTRPVEGIGHFFNFSLVCIALLSIMLLYLEPFFCIFFMFLLNAFIQLQVHFLKRRNLPAITPELFELIRGPKALPLLQNLTKCC